MATRRLTACLAFFVTLSLCTETVLADTTQDGEKSLADTSAQSTLYQMNTLAPKESLNRFSELERNILKIRKDLNIEVLAAAIVGENGIEWIKVSGSANGLDEEKATLDTRFPLGNVSKMFIGLAALKLVEQGRLDLNMPLRSVAPELKFDNLWHEKHPIRIVHLLEETTGWDSLHNAEYASNSGPNASLKEALKRYSLSRHSRWVPGTRWSSGSNSPAVAAYVIEKISGQTFESFVREHFFDPIGMRSATYFLPKKIKQDLGIDSEDIPLINPAHSRYRPIDALYASAEDMARFLAFMIRRGRSGEQTLLTPASIQRMETPTTTLGSDLGVAAVHGLGSSITGHQNYGVPFYGYRAKLTEVAYSPALKKGFIVMATDQPKGIRTVARQLKSFILKDRAQITFPENLIPEDFSDIDGYYRRISGFSERDRFITELVGVLKVTTGNTKMERRPLLGNFKTNDFYEGGKVLTNGWTGLPAIAVVDDPVVGEALQVWVTFKKVSSFSVFGRLTSVIFLTLFSSLSILFMLYWLASVFLGKLKFGPSLSIRLWPSLASVFIVYTLIVFYITGTPASLGVVSFASISVYLSSLAYLLSSSFGVFEAWRLRKAKIHAAIYWSSSALSFMHFFFGLHLSSFGLIAIRSWTV